jgi:hypothetical protein
MIPSSNQLVRHHSRLALPRDGKQSPWLVGAGLGYFAVARCNMALRNWLEIVIQD